MKRAPLTFIALLLITIGFTQDMRNQELIDKLDKMSNEELITYIKEGNNLNEVTSRYDDSEYTSFTSLFHNYGYYCENEKKEAIYLALEYAKEPIKKPLFFMNDPCGERVSDILEYFSLLVKYKHGVNESDFEDIQSTYYFSSPSEHDDEKYKKEKDSVNVAMLNYKNDSGKTILMYACELGYSHSVKKLLEKNPDLTMKDNNGKTAHDYAKANGNAEIIALFPESEKQDKKSKKKKRKKKKE